MEKKFASVQRLRWILYFTSKLLNLASHLLSYCLQQSQRFSFSYTPIENRLRGLKAGKPDGRNTGASTSATRIIFGDPMTHFTTGIWCSPVVLQQRMNTRPVVNNTSYNVPLQCVQTCSHHLVPLDREVLRHSHLKFKPTS